MSLLTILTTDQIPHVLRAVFITMFVGRIKGVWG